MRRVQAFLEANNLKLIIRSHEGPDARWKREGMQDMNKGHSLDHVTPGKPLCPSVSHTQYRWPCFTAHVDAMA